MDEAGAGTIWIKAKVDSDPSMTRRSLTQKKKVSLYTGFPKTPTGTPFHRLFLAVYVFNHGFPVAQPLVPIPSWVQFLKHLFLPPNVFGDGIRTLPNTLHNSK